MKSNTSQRLQHEIAHGKKLHSGGAESIWNWESAAGKIRAERRANYFVELARARAGDKVLELGCGTGLFTKKFRDKTKADLTAIDISEELLSEAKKILPDVTFVCCDAMQLPFAANSFEAVFGSSVLHHLEFDPVLKEIFRVLKPGGRMVFAEPNMLNPQIFLQKNIPFIKKWLGDSPDETAIVRWKFARRMQDEGFRRIRIFPYDFLHPVVPAFLTGVVSAAGRTIEKIPLLKEIAGSVIIYAEK